MNKINFNQALFKVMKNRLFSQALTSVLVMMLLTAATSCEKMVIHDEDEANVVVSIDSYEQVPFPAQSRADGETSVTRLCFHIYDDTGERIAYINQKQDDNHFGTAYFSLEKGHYYVLVVGHSADNNPSFTKNEIVKISGSDLGDTFWMMKEITVDEEVVVESMGLNRIVSRVNFIPTDKAPEEMNQIIFSYQGSKGTFNGLTGYGSTNARQRIPEDVTPNDESYGFYMIPSSDSDEIDLEIYTYHYDEMKGAQPLTKKTYHNIPVQRNRMTICKGILFDNKSTEQQLEISVVINYAWGDDIIIDLDK